MAPPSHRLIPAPIRHLRSYTLEFKARVVEEELRPDNSVSLIARKYSKRPVMTAGLNLVALSPGTANVV